MREFRVWAPNARTVEVECAGDRTPMLRHSNGWWMVEVSQALAGYEYSFVLDGGAPLPDPRSAYQPHGVHGCSQVVDHSAFRWNDQGWTPPPFAAGSIYELHIGTFTPEGTFDAAISRLDHLADLGVTYVEVMPVAEFSGDRGWGYDGVDLFAPHHCYGGPEALKRLVDACHSRGLATILDVVYNHFGPCGNYLPQFGPYLNRRYATSWGDAVNFDGPGSDEVRRFFCDNAQAWLRDYHFDGLRLDAVHAIFDMSALHFLEQLATEVRKLQPKLGRELTLIAESDLNNPRLVQPVEAGGYGLDAMWCDDFHHAIHAVLTHERGGYYADFGSLAEVAAALQRGFVYDGRYSIYRGRVHGRPARAVSGHRFVAFTQNHDQVGNRAKGDRSSHLMTIARAKIAAAFLVMSPHVPLIFQGEEWAASTPFQYFTGHEDVALAQAVSEGRRREFARFAWRTDEIPDPQAPQTFQQSKLRWEEIGLQPHTEMLEWYRTLLRLRRTVPGLWDGGFERVRVRFDERLQWFVVERPPLVMVANLAESARTVPLPHDGSSRPLVLSDHTIRIGAEKVELPPDTVAILGTEAAERATRL